MERDVRSKQAIRSNFEFILQCDNFNVSESIQLKFLAHFENPFPWR